MSCEKGYTPNGAQTRVMRALQASATKLGATGVTGHCSSLQCASYVFVCADSAASVHQAVQVAEDTAQAVTARWQVRRCHRRYSPYGHTKLRFRPLNEPFQIESVAGKSRFMVGTLDPWMPGQMRA